MKNYYEILEVNKKASKEVIDKAYKVLAKKYHPDRYTGEKQKYAETKLKDINEAYKILSDEFLKEQYDNELEKELENIYRQKYQPRDANKTDFLDDKTKYDSPKKMTKEEKREYRRKIGSLSGVIELTKELYSNRPKREEFKEMTKKDIIAILLTIVVVIIIGIILWMLPFTNWWIRELLFENPLFNWIGNLFK